MLSSRKISKWVRWLIDQCIRVRDWSVGCRRSGSATSRCFVLLQVEEHRRVALSVPEVNSVSFAEGRGPCAQWRYRICTRPALAGLRCWSLPESSCSRRSVVAGHQPLNLVEDRERIERAEPGLEIVGGQPDGVAVGLAGLRAARLAHVGANAAVPNGTSVLHIRAHLVGDADDQLEVGAHAGPVGGLLHQLQVAVAVGDGAGLLVEIRGRKHNVGERGGLGKEHILHDDEGVFQRAAVDAVARDRVRSDDVERGEIAGVCRVEHLRADRGRAPSAALVLRGERRRSRVEAGCVAGEHVGQQAHVGGAARVGVVGEQRELRVGQRRREDRPARSAPRSSEPMRTTRFSSPHSVAEVDELIGLRDA